MCKNQPKLFFSTIQAGDIIYTDRGFDCMEQGAFEVHKSPDGLYIRCDEGIHYLDHLTEDDGSISGMSPTSYPLP